jgi:hypothetical protein
MYEMHPALFFKTGCYNIRVVRDFSDVFPEELPGMPPYREVEFVIYPLPGLSLLSNDHTGGS